MKTQLSLQQLAAEIERQAETRKDYVAPQGRTEAQVIESDKGADNDRAFRTSVGCDDVGADVPGPGRRLLALGPGKRHHGHGEQPRRLVGPDRQGCVNGERAGCPRARPFTRQGSKAMPKAKPSRRRPAARALAVESMRQQKTEIARLMAKLQKQVDALPEDCNWAQVGDAAAIVQGLKELTLEVG